MQVKYKMSHYKIYTDTVEYTKEVTGKPGLCIPQFFNTQMKQQDGWFVYFPLLMTLQTLKIDSAGSIDRAVTNGINDTINSTRRINTEQCIFSQNTQSKVFFKKH